MKWLPALRRLQPRATVVILTSSAHSHDLDTAVQAIQDFQAHDIVPENISIHDLVARIILACESSRRMESLHQVQKEFRSLLRSHAARTYAEDVATLLETTKATFFMIAKQIEGGDPSAITVGPERIRAGFNSLRENFARLTSVLAEYEDQCRRVDVV